MFGMKKRQKKRLANHYRTCTSKSIEEAKAYFKNDVPDADGVDWLSLSLTVQLLMDQGYKAAGLLVFLREHYRVTPIKQK